VNCRIRITRARFRPISGAGTGLLALLLLAVAFTTAASPPGVQGYAFPITGNIDAMVWEAEHWDGRLAVDIGVHPGFPAGSPERGAFYQAEAVAVVDGTAQRLDNPRGGTAVLLHGVDGRTYYYAHLASSPITEPTLVLAGERLGRIGNTGTWSQFLEPHLHLSMAEGHQEGFFWTADIDPVRWIEQHFGRGPAAVPVTTLAGARGASYPIDEPEGYPLFSGFTTTADYDAVIAENPLLAGVRIAPRGAGSGRSVTQAPVRATMTGVVRIHRDTPLGLRMQITNARAGFSILISGPIEPVVTTGSVVFSDQIIGMTRGEIHYTIFQNGRLAGREWFSDVYLR
jgi:murein DD-endopeptidase MepM/ murein hydrolase activator NlpD